MEKCAHRRAVLLHRMRDFVILRHFAREEAGLAEVEVEAAQAAVPAMSVIEHSQTSTNKQHQQRNTQVHKEGYIRTVRVCHLSHVAASRQRNKLI